MGLFTKRKPKREDLSRCLVRDSERVKSEYRVKDYISSSSDLIIDCMTLLF